MLQSQNQGRWKKTFYIRNVCEDLTFAMIIKKVDACFGGGSKGAKATDFGGILRFKPFFCQPASTHQPHQTSTKCVSGCFTISHQSSSQNIDRKIIFVNTIKISTRWLSSFQGLFLAIIPQLFRLAG